MKKCITILLLLIGTIANAQSWETQVQVYRDSLTRISLETGNSTLFKKYTDSLRQVVNTRVNDTILVWALVELANNYKYSRWDSAVFFARKAIDLARQLEIPKAEAAARTYFFLTESAIGNHAKALQLSLENLSFCEQHNLPGDRATSELIIGWTYDKIGDFDKAIHHYKETIRSYSQNPIMASFAYSYLAKSLAEIQERDSALYYCQLANDIPDKPYWVMVLSNLSIGRAHAYWVQETKSTTRS
jgi:tetratricopeptide (TPR) repeat protein